MAEKKIHLSLVTPEERVFEGEVSSIIIPAVSGLLGILPGHLPIVSQLGVGIVKIETEEGPKYIGVYRGYLEFFYNKANILTGHAITTTFEQREETITQLKKKHEIVQKITEETKRVTKAMASLKTLEK